jgi:hypothetical protein
MFRQKALHILYDIHTYIYICILIRTLITLRIFDRNAPKFSWCPFLNILIGTRPDYTDYMLKESQNVVFTVYAQIHVRDPRPYSQTQSAWSMIRDFSNDNIFIVIFISSWSADHMNKSAVSLVQYPQIQPIGWKRFSKERNQ